MDWTGARWGWTHCYRVIRGRGDRIKSRYLNWVGDAKSLIQDVRGLSALGA